MSETLSVSLSESRYDRQERITWWDQSILATARVVVVGAGALGNEVVKNLMLVGVGEIVVIDFDSVEMSNLARCLFFRSEDEGRPKAEVLVHRSAGINDDVKITGIVGDIRSFGTGLAMRADVIVGALDNREARLYCNRLAARTGKYWVDGAIEGLMGVARVFQPPEQCYECTLTAADWEIVSHRTSCRLLSRDEITSGKVPTTASSAAVVAGIQAQEVVKILHSEGKRVTPLRGALVFDGANNDSYALSYPRSPDCLAHHFFESPLIVSVLGEDERQLAAEDLVRRAWPEARTRSTSGEFVVELGDDHVVGWSCPTCRNRTDEARPACLVPWGDSACPNCGSQRMPQLLVSISVPGPYSDEPLTALGLRSDEMLVVRRGDTERFVWLSSPDPRLPETWGLAESSLRRDGASS